MADNVTLPATGNAVATEDIGGVHFQKVMLAEQDGTPSTLLESLETIAISLARLANNQPIYTPNGQNRVTIESGSVGIAANQDIRTVTNLSWFNSQPAQAVMQQGAMTTAIYDNLKVS